MNQRDPRTEAIIGAAFRVHSQLGPGFKEKIYQEALAIEFSKRNIPYEREKNIPVFYDGIELQTRFVADFICFGEVVVELKALDETESTHFSQILNYLKATGLKTGLLLNFGQKSLAPKRVVY